MFEDITVRPPRPEKGLLIMGFIAETEKNPDLAAKKSFQFRHGFTHHLRGLRRLAPLQEHHPDAGLANCLRGRDDLLRFHDETTGPVILPHGTIGAVDPTERNGLNTLTPDIML